MGVGGVRGRGGERREEGRGGRKEGWGGRVWGVRGGRERMDGVLGGGGGTCCPAQLGPAIVPVLTG